MSDIARRKDEHLDICREDPVESGRPTGFAAWRLDYLALPEIALEDVDLSIELAGKRLAAPIVIGAMTGGTDDAGALNKTLAEAAERTGVGFALGSGRVVLERPETASTFQVRDVAPSALVFANLGAVQFNYGVTGEDAQRLVEVLEADAINLHLNPLQEAIQPEGDTNFRGLSAAITEALKSISAPVFVKEVGAGIGTASAQRLAEMAIAGVETAGVGGTSWARVEALRHESAKTRHSGIALGGLGVPTSESILACRQAMPNRVVIASGGIRSAEDMAKSLALGADACATALPFLKAAVDGVEGVVAAIERFIHTLKILHFVCGARRPHELRGRIQRVS